MSDDTSRTLNSDVLEFIQFHFSVLQDVFSKLDAYNVDPQILKEVLTPLYEIRHRYSDYGDSPAMQIFHYLENIVKTVSKGKESVYTGLSYALNVFEVIEGGLDGATDFESCFQEEDLEFVKTIYHMFTSEKEEKRILTERERATVDKVFKEVTFYDFAFIDADQRMLLEDFIEEALEPMEEIEDKLIAAESDPSVLEIDTVFRQLHSIKGTSSFLGLRSIQHVSHAGENLLDKARSNPSFLSEQVIKLSLRVIDMVRLLFSNLTMKLEQSKDQKARFPAVIEMEPLLRAIEFVLEGKDVDLLNLGEIESKFILDTSDSSDSKDSKESTIRISTAKMEELYSMIGELTVLVNAIKEDPTFANARFQSKNKIDKLVRVTDNLRTKVVDTHMLPLGGIYKRLQRLISDLARKCNKKIVFLSEGEEIEIHKSTFEILYNFLVHMIRNSVDHGLENSEQRKSEGKPEEGSISLITRVTSDTITLVLSDDGQGLNRDAIIAKAIEKDLLGEDEKISDEEAYGLIFQPGFSTAKEVSDLSGRGVGMDVVKTAITQLNGEISVNSVPGMGTSFTIDIPLMTSTSIIDGLVARVGDTYLILPIFSVEHTFCPMPDEIKKIQGSQGEFVVYRDAIIPIIRLSSFFNINESEQKQNSVIFVVRVEGKLFGLIVDELLSQQQVVVENLKEHFEHLIGISGGAILGNGRFGLILDTKMIIESWQFPN